MNAMILKKRKSFLTKVLVFLDEPNGHSGNYLNNVSRNLMDIPGSI